MGKQVWVGPGWRYRPWGLHTVDVGDEIGLVNIC